MLAGLQMVTSPLFLLAIRHRLDTDSRWLLNLPMAVWIFLPLGALYGLYVGRAKRSGSGGRVARWLGMLANAIYLLVAVLIWTAIFSGGIFV